MLNLANDLALALDPVQFACKALGFVPEPWQVGVLREATSDMLLNCHRQAGKSTVTAIKGLHRVIYKPEALVLLFSITEDQSIELFKKLTTFLKKLDVHPGLDKDTAQGFEFDNGSRVLALPGKPSSVRGYSAPDLVIVDEAAQVPDEMFTAISPMRARNQGQMIEMSTPFGKRGHFYKEWQESSAIKIEVPVTHTPRITQEFLKAERRRLGERAFMQEYYCQFRDTIEQVFPTDLIERAVTADLKAMTFLTGGKA